MVDADYPLFNFLLFWYRYKSNLLWVFFYLGTSFYLFFEQVISLVLAERSFYFINFMLLSFSLYFLLWADWS